MTVPAELIVSSVDDPTRPDLDAALTEFERAGANLEKAERVWAELSSERLTAEEHEHRQRVYMDFVAALPALDGFRVTQPPMSKVEIEVARFEAGEVDDPDLYVRTEEKIGAPGAELREYRHRFQQARKDIVRSRVREVVKAIDRLVRSFSDLRDARRHPALEDWRDLGRRVAELERLLADSVPGAARWEDLRRHIAFAEDVDLNDIIDKDWPSVRAEVEGSLYDEWEPVPVDVDDLATLVAAEPTGRVTTALDWTRLDDEGFERLIFELLSTTPGYENVNWPMKTKAADQGRDVEGQRVTADQLSGTRRERVIVQCKHWRRKSVGRDDLVLCVQAVNLWAPPLVDVLIVASSGRFSKDAVTWAERRNEAREVPRVELWPDSHLEALLARRPYVAASFGLR